VPYDKVYVHLIQPHFTWILTILPISFVIVRIYASEEYDATTVSENSVGLRCDFVTSY